MGKKLAVVLLDGAWYLGEVRDEEPQMLRHPVAIVEDVSREGSGVRVGYRARPLFLGMRVAEVEVVPRLTWIPDEEGDSYKILAKLYDDTIEEQRRAHSKIVQPPSGVIKLH